MGAGLLYLPHLPSRTLTRLILDYAERAADGPKMSRIPKKQLFAALSGIGKQHDAVANEVARYRSKLPDVPILICSNVRKPMAVGDLSEIERKQLELAGKLYDGLELTAEQRLDAKPSEELEEASFHGMVELGSIVDEAGQPAYDVWQYMGDSGTIFQAGTTEEVACIIQGGLECQDRALRLALQDVLRNWR